MTLYVNCANNRLGEVQRVIITKLMDGKWDVAFDVDCGDPENTMIISRHSQTHVFFNAKTQRVVASVLAAIESMNDSEEEEEEDLVRSIG